MSPDATHQDLVYVSDAPANSVKVYGFTTHKLVGTLTGINGPFGVCDDPAGYVWVVAWGNNKIIEYAHGGTKVLKILSVPNSDLYDCAVDPTTGNLAVTNWGAKNWYRGNVLIFKPGSTKPETYAGGQVWFYYGVTYDDKGNLFTDGWASYLTGVFTLAELPKGSEKMKRIALSPDIEPPILGGVRWDGKYVAIGNWTTVVEYQVQGSFAQRRGYTQMSYHWPIGLFSITRTGQRKIIAPDTAGDPGAIQYWNYPRGGNPTYTIKEGRSGPFAATLSLAH